MFIQGIVFICLCFLFFELGKRWALYKIEKEKEALALQEHNEEWKRFLDDYEKGGEG